MSTFAQVDAEDLMPLPAGEFAQPEVVAAGTGD